MLVKSNNFANFQIFNSRFEFFDELDYSRNARISLKHIRALTCVSLTLKCVLVICPSVPCKCMTGSIDVTFGKISFILIFAIKHGIVLCVTF